MTKEYITKISFNDATLNIQYRYVGVCNKCNGTRSELGYTGNICPYCEGTGEDRQHHRQDTVKLLRENQDIHQVQVSRVRGDGLEQSY